MILFKILPYCLFFCSCFIYGQNLEPCATDTKQKELFNKDSLAYKNYLDAESIALKNMIKIAESEKRKKKKVTTRKKLNKKLINKN